MALHSAWYQPQPSSPAAMPHALPWPLPSPVIPQHCAHTRLLPNSPKLGWSWARVGRDFLGVQRGHRAPLEARSCQRICKCHCSGLAEMLQLYRASIKLHRNGVLVGIKRVPKVLHHSLRVVPGFPLSQCQLKVPMLSDAHHWICWCQPSPCLHYPYK